MFITGATKDNYDNFDCGDCEMNVCDKYVSNGWATFNCQEEDRTVGDKWEMIDKWWLKRTHQSRGSHD